MLSAFSKSDLSVPHILAFDTILVRFDYQDYTAKTHLREIFSWRIAQIRMACEQLCWWIGLTVTKRPQAIESAIASWWGGAGCIIKLPKYELATEPVNKQHSIWFLSPFLSVEQLDCRIARWNSKQAWLEFLPWLSSVMGHDLQL